MTFTELREARLRSVETATLLNAKKLMSVCALASGILTVPNISISTSGEYQGHTRSTSDSFRTVRVLRGTSELRPRLEAKTELARRLLALRTEAIRGGMPLLSQEEVLSEVRRRRGENV